MPSPVLKAMQGQDTEDFLSHIAWAELIRPVLEKDRSALVKLLVEMTLRPTAPGAETKEQVAGRIWGIDHTITLIERLVKEGRQAKETLAASHIHLIDTQQQP